MYSVFTKTITEPSAVDILRNYSNPNSPDFGDAQQIYADLCDHFEGGAIGQVTITELETQLTTLHLNKSWTKSVSHFVHFVTGKIKDHKDLTNSNHDDHYYVKKLNATFEEHKDMKSTVDVGTQRNYLQPISYESQLFELKQHATTLDHRYKKNQSSRKAHEASSRHDTSGGRNSGNQDTGNGGRGRGNGGRGSGGRRNFGRGPGGRGSGGRGNAGCGRSGGWLPRDEYFALSREEPERRRNQYNNDNNSNNDSSGAPRAYNNSNHSSVNNNNGGGSNMNVSQPQQRSTNSSQQDHNNGSSNPSPGAMVRNMVSNASARSAINVSTNEQEVMFNGCRYRLA
eukprot:scaffold11733_cov150-Amphora_coffeaeformis.AAC.1